MRKHTIANLQRELGSQKRQKVALEASLAAAPAIIDATQNKIDDELRKEEAVEGETEKEPKADVWERSRHAPCPRVGRYL